MTTLAQRSFAGGEVSPSLYSRVDTVKYTTGVRTLRNMLVMRQGGAASRPGTRFCAEVSNSAQGVRLIPFIFNTTQSYELEFGAGYIRIYKDGVQLTDVTKTITGVSQASPCIVTSAAHGFIAGNEVQISGVAGMTTLNSRNFKVGIVTTNTFQILYMDGTLLDSTAFPAYVSGGSASRVYQASTPYAFADLPLLKYVQSNDVMTLVHPSYEVYSLGRVSDTDWTMTASAFVPGIAPPTGLSVTASGGSVTTLEYAVTAISATTGEESLLCAGVTNTGAIPTVALPWTMLWNVVTGASSYNVYKNSNGIWGFIGVAGNSSPSYTQPSFIDIGLSPDATEGPPDFPSPSPFTTADNYPGTVGYFQQRLCFADSNNAPFTAWCSTTGQFNNFGTNTPIQDNDSVTFTMVSRQANPIQHIIDIGQMVIFTSAGEWVAQGNAGGVLTPSAINLRQYSYYGSSPVPPIIIGSDILFVQARGSVVRDFVFDFMINGYRGNDLTIFSSHLIDGYTIVDWAFCQIPNSIVWMVRSDGALLGLTYVKEQQILGWHHHDFGGKVLSVCSVPEGSEDVLYMVIERQVEDGVGTGYRTAKYIERMNTRLLNPAPTYTGTTGIVDYVGTDSSLTYDGRNTEAFAATATLSGGTTWEYTETLTLTLSAALPSALAPGVPAPIVGNEIHLTGYDGTQIRFTVTGVTSSTVFTGTPNKTVLTDLTNQPTTAWAIAVNEVGGLWQLNGNDVSILADGFVVASVNNSDYPIYVVSNGTLVLDRCYSVITVGLPVTCDLETLNIDLPGEQSIADKKKIITKVTTYVQDSRGLWAGGAAPSGQPTDDEYDPLEGLTEYKAREFEDADAPICLATDTLQINIASRWNNNGRVFIRQVDPLPLTVLAVIPAGLIPPTGGA